MVFSFLSNFRTCRHNIVIAVVKGSKFKGSNESDILMGSMTDKFIN